MMMLALDCIFFEERFALTALEGGISVFALIVF
jgi:hypothetical protein